MTHKNAVALSQAKKALVKGIKGGPRIRVNGASQTTGHGKMFLADLSSSMSGEKESMLKDAVQDVFPKHPGAKLCGYGEAHVWDIEPEEFHQEYTQGSTPMLKALQHAWSCEVKEIVLCTDGEATDATDEEILDAARMHHSTPIHTLGIGTHFNEDFLRQLSLITNGKFMKVGEDELHLLSDSVNTLMIGGGNTDAGGNVIQL